MRRTTRMPGAAKAFCATLVLAYAQASSQALPTAQPAQPISPTQARLLEAGWQYQRAGSELSATVFDIRQSNLPARDPQDNNAFVLIGSNRSRGVELRAIGKALGADLSANLTRLNARVENPVNPTQGAYLTGAADGYGSVKVALPLAGVGDFWVATQFAASRPGNDRADFRAPGYAVLSLGLNGHLGTTLRWSLRLDNAADRRYVRALTGADNVWQGERRRLTAWVEGAFGP